MVKKRLLLYFCVAGVSVAGLCTLFLIRSTDRHSTSTAQTIPPALNAILARTLGKEDPAYHIDALQLTAPNPRHGYTASFTNKGVAFSSGFTLSTPDFNYTNPTITDNVITYAHDTYTEWYVNSPLGIEQGFTLTEPTDITIVITDAQGISLHENKKGVSITTNSTTLAYQGLVAFDANGKELNATFTKSSPATLAIHVDDTHATYPITIDPYVQEQKLTADDGADNDQFGNSIAIDSTGTRAVVGANLDANGGSAYIFLRTGTSWAQEAKIVADDVSGFFGFSVSIDSTGTRVIVGAYSSDITHAERGAAYIFLRTGTSWAQEAKIVADDAAPTDHFGRSVSIDSTGTRVAVGADGDSIGINTGQGSAYIFLRTGTSWAQEAKIVADDGAAGDRFGGSISIDSTGTRVVVGVRFDNISQGAAYIFLRTTSWAQEAKIVADDGAAGDYFGVSVSIDSTGTRVAVGAYGDDSYEGSAYIFLRTTSWAQEAKIVADDGAAGDDFGYSVSIDSTGTRVVVGADGQNSGGGSSRLRLYLSAHGHFLGQGTKTNC